MWAEICQDNLCNQMSECMNSWKPNDLSFAIYFTFIFLYYAYNCLMQCNIPQVLLKKTQKQS